MFNLNKIKTPHGNPLTHFAKMFGFFAIGTAAVLFLGLGASVSGSLPIELLTAAGVALATLLGGIFSTMILRTVFGLVQTGRMLQYASFAFAGTASILLFAWCFPATITVSSSLLAGLLVFAFAFGPATLAGTVPFKGRSWLPVRKQNNNRKPPLA